MPPREGQTSHGRLTGPWSALRAVPTHFVTPPYARSVPLATLAGTPNRIRVGAIRTPALVAAGRGWKVGPESGGGVPASPKPRGGGLRGR